MNKAKIIEIFERFAAREPEPKTELEFTNNFTLLVAVVPSAQATDKGVNKATKALFVAADTPAKMVALGEEKIRDYIKTIGLFRAKAKNVFALSQMVVEEFGGEVPRKREDLERLAGVGRKTANVVLNVAWGEPTMAVDTHIFRVSNRIGLARAKNPLQTEQQLMKNIPKKFMEHAHHWLILHGRYICIARKPRCGVCPIADLCKFKEKNLPEN
jgi:endonuclease-3